MKDKITIHLADYYCRNCDRLNKERNLCQLQQIQQEPDDVACSQIFDNYKKEE